MIIDTHLHLIDKTALDYPWLETTPALNRSWLYDDYARQAKQAGITGALHMEVDVAAAHIEKETRIIAAQAKESGSLIRGAIAACRPEDKGFADTLDAIREQTFVKGFRRVLHVVPDDLPQTPLFAENLQRLAGTGLTFDLCVLPHQLATAGTLADSAPDVTFILDHCGVPDIAAGAREPWLRGLEELARRPNVIAKISGVVAYTQAGRWEVDTLRPWVEHTITCFGWDRVVWGSDWPVCTLGGGLLAWVAATHALLAGASESERTKLFSENAKRIWTLEPGR